MPLRFTWGNLTNPNAGTPTQTNEIRIPRGRVLVSLKYHQSPLRTICLDLFVIWNGDLSSKWHILPSPLQREHTVCHWTVDPKTANSAPNRQIQRS